VSGCRVPGLPVERAVLDRFLTHPYRRLAVSNPDDVEALVLLLAVVLAVTELALWGRR
jgi:hypothetical protein